MFYWRFDILRKKCERKIFMVGVKNCAGIFQTASFLHDQDGTQIHKPMSATDHLHLGLQILATHLMNLAKNWQHENQNCLLIICTHKLCCSIVMPRIQCITTVFVLICFSFQTLFVSFSSVRHSVCRSACQYFVFLTACLLFWSTFFACLPFW